MTASLLDHAKACAGSYEPSAVAQFQDALKLVHVHLSMIDGVHNFTWEGTTDWEEWIFSDFMCAQVPVFDHPKIGPVHLGLARDVLSVLPAIIAYMDGLDWPPFTMDGHSKGAGEVILAHAFLKDLGHSAASTTAFEPPRVGTAALAAFLRGENIIWTRTRNIHGPDIVTLVPWGGGVTQILSRRWEHISDPLILTVPDADDIPTKHRIPAVIAALAALPGLKGPDPAPAVGAAAPGP